MKKEKLRIVLTAALAASLLFASCGDGSSSDSGGSGSGSGSGTTGGSTSGGGSGTSGGNQGTLDPEETINNPDLDGDIYKDFAASKVNARGTLTLKTQLTEDVLVFTDSVLPQYYIGRIPASSSIKVRLEANKFYNIVAVRKSAYDENQEKAAQISELAYYSDTQAYVVSVSPSNLTGNGTWIFNNYTNYWVSIEKTDNSGETFAVISPEARSVSVPMDSSVNYNYKIVYKQQLKYQGVTMALVDKSFTYQSDTAYFAADNNYQFITDLKLDGDTSSYDNLLPSVVFTNNTGRTIRVFNGNTQLTNFGAISDNPDYVLGSAKTAVFTGFAETAVASTIGFRSESYIGLQPCTDSTQFEKGKVYYVSVKNKGTDASPNFEWTVEGKAASAVYDTE